MTKRLPILPAKTFLYNELSSEPLVNYLSRRYPEENETFNTEDLTRLFRKAMQTEITFEPIHKINGWQICGSISHYNEETNTISLPVILSTNRVLEIKSQGRDNQYAIDLAVLRYLHAMNSGSNCNIQVIAIDRLFTHYKAMPTKLLNIIPIEDSYDNNEIETMLSERLKLLDSQTKPGICKNLRYHKKLGKTKRMQCSFYCNFGDVCPHNSKNNNYKVSKKSMIF